MADFVLKKRKDFVFEIDGAKGQFTLPGRSSLSFDDVALFDRLRRTEADTTQRGNIIKEFILKYAPGLEELDLADMAYLDIMQAYEIAQGRALGE